MSNKLKTLSPSQLEKLISEKVSHYINEQCSCDISELDTPNIDTEADPAVMDERNITFSVKLSYIEEK